MSPLFPSVLMASFVGSLHCAGMCGGLSAFSAAGATGKQRPFALAAYHLTRGTGYVLLGTLAGALGHVIDDVGLRTGVGRVAGVLAGLVMLGWGAVKLAQYAGIGVKQLALPPALESAVAKMVRLVQSRPPVLRGAVVGACTAALPCGWLHAFTVVAAGTGSAPSGALVLFGFWLGTVPALLGIGLSAQAFTARLKRSAGLLSALALVVVGLASVAGRLSVPLVHSVSQQTHAAVPDHPPCHGH